VAQTDHRVSKSPCRCADNLLVCISHLQAVVRCRCSALYTIVSFPFLFSLMFGDVGHALLLVFAAVGMIVFEKRFLKKRSKNDVTTLCMQTFLADCLLSRGFCFTRASVFYGGVYELSLVPGRFPCENVWGLFE